MHRYALSILETAWVPEFSMFLKKIAFMHEWSMENLPADSTRVIKQFMFKLNNYLDDGSLTKMLFRYHEALLSAL